MLMMVFAMFRANLGGRAGTNDDTNASAGDRYDTVDFALATIASRISWKVILVFCNCATMIV